MNRVQLPTRQWVHSIEDLANEFESLFGRVAQRPATAESNGVGRFVPALDVSETADAFHVSVDLPGIKPEDVKVEVRDEVLSLSGKRETVVETKEKNYHRVERSGGSFQRSMVLPSPVDQDRIEATYEAGVLHISLPKALKNQAKQIQIKTNGN